MSVCISTSTSPLQSFCEQLSKEYQEWHQFQFITVPLINALHKAITVAPAYATPNNTNNDDDVNEYAQYSAPLSLTPSLVCDKSSSLPSNSSPKAPGRQRRRLIPQLARHTMITRAGLRWEAKRQAFWELDRSGRTARRIPPWDIDNDKESEQRYMKVWNRRASIMDRAHRQWEASARMGWLALCNVYGKALGVGEHHWCETR